MIIRFSVLVLGCFIGVGITTGFLVMPADNVSAATISKPPNNLGLVGYWPMNEARGSEIGDFSVNNHTGTLSGDTKWVDGVRAGAVDFDGDNDYIELDSYKGIGGSQERSVTAWVKLRQADETNRFITWGTNNTGEKYHIRSNGSAGHLRVENAGGNHYGVDPEQPINDGEWHHIAVVLPAGSSDVTDHKLYVDGEQYTNTSGSSQSMDTDTSTNVRFGSPSSAQGQSTDDTDGQLDDVRIYDRALSDSDIANLYDSGQATMNETPELVAGKPSHATGETVVGEAGTFSAAADGGWKTVNFLHNYDEPVVVGTINSADTESGVVFESRNVTGSDAEMRLCEIKGDGGPSDGCASLAAGETGGYMVIDAADVDDIPGIDAGTFDIDSEVDSKTKNISFRDAFSNTPKVFASVQTVNGGDPIEARVINMNTSSFDGGICHQNSNDGCDSNHGTETVGWVAIEPDRNVFDKQHEVGATGNSVSGSSWTQQTFSNSFSSDPAVIVEQQTQDGGQESEVDEARNVSTSDVDVRYCENQSDGTCDGHTTEDVAWFAAETGTLRRDDDLISSWTMDGPDVDGSTVTDVHGPHDGTINGSPTNVSGRLGQALSFDGTDDWVNAGDIDQFDNPGFWSVSFWFRRDADQAANSNHNTSNVMFAQADDNDNDNIEIGTDGSNVEIYIDSTGGDTDNAYDAGIQNGEWYYFTLTYNKNDSNETKLYIDGKQVKQWSTWGGNLDDSEGAPIAIGKTDHEDVYFNGRMDDVRIYNNELTAEEVQRAYKTTEPDRVSVSSEDFLNNSLVGMWTFDQPDISGMTITDVSGSGNDGTKEGNSSPIIGNIGQGYYFDGNGDRIEISDSDALSGGTSATISASVWFKIPSSDSGGILVYKQWDTADGDWGIKADTSGGLQYYSENGGGDYNLSGGTVEKGKWYHAAMVLDQPNDTLTLYLDGEQVAQDTSTGTISADTDGNVYIGANVYNNSSINAEYEGIMDNVRVYNRVLSAEEVKKLHGLGR